MARPDDKEPPVADGSRPSPLLPVGIACMLGALLAAVLLGAAGGRAGAQEEQGEDRRSVSLGQRLYGTDCATCHGELGRGVEDLGPPLIGVGAASVDFMLRTGRMPLPSPDAVMRRGYSIYTDEQRRALIDYITSFPGEGPPIPEVDPEAGDLRLGRAIYVSQCAACHGPTAAGIAVGQRDVSSNLDVASPLEIAEAIRTGPGVMPVFGEQILGQEELDSVTAWVLHLRERETPGGVVSIGRSGPVVEGLMAWLVGMGLLVVVIYLLGDKETVVAEEREEGA